MPRPLLRPRSALPLCALALLAVLVAGCLPAPGDEPEPPAEYVAEVARQDAEDRDEALALLTSADASAFRRAFATLRRASFRRYARTEQRTRDGDLIAYQTLSVRHLAGAEGQSAARYVRLDSTRGGTFDFGLFQRFVSANVTDLDADDLAPFVLPEDPAYLEERQRDAYYFWLGPDTLLGDVQARQVRVRARPDVADGQNIRRARVYLHPQTGRVLAAELDRVDLAMLFREESTFFVHVAYLSDSVAVPVNTRFRSLLRTPFRPPQAFSTRTSYSEIVLSAAPPAS